MAKYRGKYKKCRSCMHAIDNVLMVLVEVKPSCPNGIDFSCFRAAFKARCEICEHYSERGEM